jgi:hypothetical protein
MAGVSPEELAALADDEPPRARIEAPQRLRDALGNPHGRSDP